MLDISCFKRLSEKFSSFGSFPISEVKLSSLINQNVIYEENIKIPFNYYPCPKPYRIYCSRSCGEKSLIYSKGFYPFSVVEKDCSLKCFYNMRGQLHRNSDKPALLYQYVECETSHHNKEKYSYNYYLKEYYKKGRLHRLNKCARKSYNQEDLKEDLIIERQYYENDIQIK